MCIWASSGSAGSLSQLSRAGVRDVPNPIILRVGGVYAWMTHKFIGIHIIVFLFCLVVNFVSFVDWSTLVPITSLISAALYGVVVSNGGTRLFSWGVGLADTVMQSGIYELLSDLMHLICIAAIIIRLY